MVVRHVNVLLLLLLSSASAMAAEEVSLSQINEQSQISTQAPQPGQSVVTQKYFSLGYRYASFDYKEPGLMREHGNLNGVYGQFETPLSDTGEFSFKGEAEFLAGTIRYDGAYSNGEPVSSNSKDYTYTLRGGLGYNVMVEERMVFRPYAALATRYLNDHAEGLGGYEREITYLYMPLGVEIKAALQDDWIVGFAVEYDLFLGGTVVSHIDQVGSNYPKAENHQSRGSGYRLSAQTVHRLSENVSVQVEPYFQRWNIEDSDVYYDRGVGWYEPKNNTSIAGLSAGVLF